MKGKSRSTSATKLQIRPEMFKPLQKMLSPKNKISIVRNIASVLDKDIAQKIIGNAQSKNDEENILKTVAKAKFNNTVDPIKESPKITKSRNITPLLPSGRNISCRNLDMRNSKKIFTFNASFEHNPDLFKSKLLNQSVMEQSKVKAHDNSVNRFNSIYSIGCSNSPSPKKSIMKGQNSELDSTLAITPQLKKSVRFNRRIVICQFQKA